MGRIKKGVMMTKWLLLFLLMFCFIQAGCATLDRFAPQKIDETTGEPIPGSREAIDPVKDVAGSIPYGSLVLNVLLLAVAGVEKYKANKLDKGLRATLSAGKAVANDPEMAKYWAKVKESYYKPVHEGSGVTSLIKAYLAKL